VTDTLNLLALAQAAIKFAQAATDTTQHRKRLDSAYFDWRKDSGNLGTHIVRNDPDWLLMMQATADQYRQLRNAKSREYRAKAKLLAVARAMEMTE
jgi:hypothetical protein